MPKVHHVTFNLQLSGLTSGGGFAHTPSCQKSLCKAWAHLFLHRHGASQNCPGHLYISACCCVFAWWRWAWKSECPCFNYAGFAPLSPPRTRAALPSSAQLHAVKGEWWCSVLPKEGPSSWEKISGFAAPSPPSCFPPGKGWKLVRSPEPPGETLLDLHLCWSLTGGREGGHIHRLMQTWGETQFFVCKTLFVSPWPMQTVLTLVSPHALGAWICLATSSGCFQHQNSLFPGPDPPNSFVVSLHSGDTSSPMKCHWKTLLNLYATLILCCYYPVP